MTDVYVVILKNHTEIEVNADGYNVTKDKNLILYTIDDKGECETVLNKAEGEWNAFYCRSGGYEDWRII